MSQWHYSISQPYFTCCYQATTHVTGNDWFSEHYEEELTKDNFSVFFVFQQFWPLNLVSKYSQYHSRDQYECSESWWACSEHRVRVYFDFYTSRKVVLLGQVGWKQQHHLADCAGLYTYDVDLMQFLKTSVLGYWWVVYLKDFVFILLINGWELFRLAQFSQQFSNHTKSSFNDQCLHIQEEPIG